MDKLMLPERLSPFLAPWLQLRAGNKSGWQTPSELALNWTGVDRLEPFEGIARRFLLAPVQQVIRDLHPPKGAKIWRFPELRANPEEVVTDASGAGEAEVLLHADAAKPESETTLVIFSGKQTRLLALRSGDKTVYADIAGYAPILIGYAVADLDNNGADELLLEFAQVYGDGWFSTLWVIDGARFQGELRVSSIALGGSGGEPGGSDIDATWWVDGRRVWIIRSGAVVKALALRYAEGRFVSIPSAPHAAILGRYNTRLAAQRLAWAGRSRTHGGPRVFRAAKSGKAERWIAGFVVDGSQRTSAFHPAEVMRFELDKP
jgi:hypothetical protein